MDGQQERRAEGIERVPVQAFVEVCGTDGSGPAFEAESADLSGRGMQLRTAYLPELGSPVMCRFEAEGQEVLAEGVVAWRKEQARGGDFGVKFTALDAASAALLGDLCGLQEHAEPAAESDYESPMPPVVETGAKVKLHIEGLGSPMRARVQDGNSRKLRVGSTLEFLRIGKKLQLESVDLGQRREARIDGLDVVVDPRTGVPQLVVLLRTSDEQTPQPSVVDRSEAGFAPIPAHKRTLRATLPEPAADDVLHRSAAAEDDSEDFGARLEGSWGRVSQTLRQTSEGVAALGARVGQGMAPHLSGLMSRLRQGRAAPSESPVRRRTSPPPGGGVTIEGKGISSQHRSRSSAPPTAVPVPAPAGLDKKKLKTWGGAAVAVALLATVVVAATRGGNASTVAAAPSASAAGGIAAAAAVAAVQPLGSVGLVAKVPLFGATAMATLEAAPVGSAAANEVPADVAAREMALAKTVAAPTAAGSDASSDSSEEPGEPTVAPEDVPPFGHGKMKDPTVFRLKLDGPGEAIVGKKTSKGFVVTIPKRKTRESAKEFAKRDPRIAKVTAANGDDGVKIIWQFGKETPGYRVRLRKDSVEFLLSTELLKPSAH